MSSCMRVSLSRASTSRKRRRRWPCSTRSPHIFVSPMRYIRSFREGAAAAALAKLLIAEVDPGREYHLMEFCGGHTAAIFRYGVEDLLPSNVRPIHGPGCPVCVLAGPRLDAAIELAQRLNVTLVSYGDMLRVPASRRRSLLKARAQGADVRMAYSALEALDVAAAHPEREVVFFAIGFETTTPATAHLILDARRLGLSNFSVYCNHVVTPAAIQSILDSPEVREWGQVRVDGFIGPSHVSAGIGSRPYEYFAEEYQPPSALAGCRTAGCPSNPPTPVSIPSGASPSTGDRLRKTRRASARRSSAASRNPQTAQFSELCARRVIRSARAWCPRKALAPPIISIVAARCRWRTDAYPVAR